VELYCSVCGRPAPPLDLGVSREILRWKGGEMAMVSDDPLMFEELVCPTCRAQGIAESDDKG